MYASVADLRAEGVTSELAADERLAGALAEATALIDRVTGWYFEPRQATVRLSGRGTSALETPVPPIRIDVLRVAGDDVLADELELEGSPVPPWFVVGSLRLRFGRTFPRGCDNVIAIGLWGYTEHDGTPTGRTPLAIRRAAMLLALQLTPKLGEGDGGLSQRQQWRIVEERTRDQSYRLAPVEGRITALTGDADIDRLLTAYCRPGGLGSA